MKELDNLAQTLNKLSKEDRDALLDRLKDKDDEDKHIKPVNKMRVLEDENENPRIREASKKIHKNTKKKPAAARPTVKMKIVKCLNCNKEFNLPEDYPDINKFICCVK